MKVSRVGLHWLPCEQEVVKRLTKLNYFPSEIVPYLPAIRTVGGIADFVRKYCNPGRKPGAYGAAKKPLPVRYGFDHPRARLNKRLARRIVRKHSVDKLSQRRIANDLGLSRTIVRNFLAGETYREFER